MFKLENFSLHHFFIAFDFIHSPPSFDSNGVRVASKSAAEGAVDVRSALLPIPLLKLCQPFSEGALPVHLLAERLFDARTLTGQFPRMIGRPVEDHHLGCLGIVPQRRYHESQVLER